MREARGTRQSTAVVLPGNDEITSSGVYCKSAEPVKKMLRLFRFRKFFVWPDLETGDLLAVEEP